FALPVTDVDRVVVRYADGLSLLRDLKAMGETNVLSERSRTMLRRDVLARAMSLLAEGAAAEDGRFAVPFEVVFATGWAPHESQQKPLKPGAAAIRLSKALGVEETSAGEKAGS
ncbi:MAG: SAM-dependent methyltransferase, partial [Pseudomonadota bacterium]